MCYSIIRVAQQLINGEDKERLETIESTSAQSFRTFSDLDSIIRRKEEELNKKTKHKYDNKHLAQQYIECLKSKDEMPTLEQYEAYMSYRIDQHSIQFSEEDIQLNSSNT